MQRIKRNLLKVNCKVVRLLSSSKLVFVSARELVGYTAELGQELPRTFDVVCAVPRAGLIVGGLLAQNWNLPLSTPELLSRGLCWNVSGQNSEFLTAKEFRKVLLVDDSIGSGRTLKDSERLIRKRVIDADIVKAVIITTHEGKSQVDYYKRVIHAVDSVFEWQLGSSRYRNWSVACDFDGVICNETTLEPLFIPHYVLDAIVTARPEARRKETEDWLKRYDVRYRQIFLDDKPLAKIEIIRKLKPKFFIESDDNLARDIWRLANVPTLSYQKMVMYS